PRGGPRPRQRRRWRGRARPPGRHVRRPARAHPRPGTAPPGRRARRGCAVRRRRSGRRAAAACAELMRRADGMSEAAAQPGPGPGGNIRRSKDIPLLVARAREGDHRAVARLISLVEAGDDTVPEIAARLAPYTGNAEIIGLTGSPGVGKSTTT